MAEAARLDHFLAGALGLWQPLAGHRSGTDAVLLAAAIAEPAGLLIDAGAGVGAAGLMMARRDPKLEVLLAEIDPPSVALAAKNIAENGLAPRVRAVEADILSAKGRRAAHLVDGGADIVIANPPWLAPDRTRASPDARRALAHTSAGGLATWLRALAALAKADARMAVILPAAEIAKLIEACEGRFGDLAILPVHPHQNDAAIRIVAAGRRGSRAPLRIMPGLVLHGEDGAFTPRAQALHRGEAILGLL